MQREDAQAQWEEAQAQAARDVAQAQAQAARDVAQAQAQREDAKAQLEHELRLRGNRQQD